MIITAVILLLLASLEVMAAVPLVTEAKAIHRLQTQSIDDAALKDETDMINGLILNRTMTRVGHRFYREFVGAYRSLNAEADHLGLTIEEKATARNGSIISIYNNRKKIFITAVSPASRNLDQLAQAAASRVNTIVKQNKNQASWAKFLNPDLAEDEF